MNTIYMLTLGDYMEDFLEGFATNDEEIEQMVVNHHYRDFIQRDVRVEIDWERCEVTAIPSKCYFQATYTIHKINRVTKEYVQ